MALSPFQPTLPFAVPQQAVSPLQGQLFNPALLQQAQLQQVQAQAASPTLFSDLRGPRLFGQNSIQPGNPHAMWNTQLPNDALSAEQRVANAQAAYSNVGSLSGRPTPLAQLAPEFPSVPTSGITAVGTPASSAAMPADTAFGNSLGAAVQGGEGSFAPLTAAAPSGIMGTIEAAGKGLLPGIAPYMAGSELRGVGDSTGNSLLSGMGLGAQAGGMAVAGSGALAAAAPGLGISALPVLPTAAAVGAGVGLGNLATGNDWFRDHVINNIRGAMGKDATADTFTDLFKNGGALSSVPLLGQGGGDNAGGPDLSEKGMSDKLLAVGLSPTVRHQAATHFNAAIQAAKSAGKSQDQATAAAYSKMFGGVDDKGQPTSGDIADYQAQDQQTKDKTAQDQETAYKAVAMQSLISQLAPQILAPMISAGDQYNAMAPGVIASLPGNMQGWAQKQGMDFNRNQSNRVADTASFYNQLPLMLAQQQQAAQQAQIQQQVQAINNANALQAAGITKNSSTSSGGGIADLIAKAQGK